LSSWGFDFFSLLAPLIAVAGTTAASPPQPLSAAGAADAAPPAPPPLLTPEAQRAAAAPLAPAAEARPWRLSRALAAPAAAAAGLGGVLRLARAASASLSAAAPPSAAPAPAPERDRAAADALSPLAQGDVVFLSARPGFLRGQTRALSAEMGLGHAAILCGSLSAALGNARIAARKLSNHLRHSALFPEYRVVFLGDSGQADVAVAQQVAMAHERLRAEQAAAHAGAGANAGAGALAPLLEVPLPLCLIHDIRGASQAPRTPEAQRAALRARGVHVFDSYIEAAALCLEAGLLTERALGRVVEAAAAQLAQVDFGAGGEAMRRARMAEFSYAVRRAQMAVERARAPAA